MAIAGLVTAFAQPFISRIGSDSAKVDTVILVLDRSPSMELVTNEGSGGSGKTKRELVIENVLKSMASMPEAKLKLVDSATGKMHDILSVAALPQLPQTAATDKIADIPRLISTAITQATDKENNLGKTEIWVASDLQQSNWQPDSKDWKSINAQFQAGAKTKIRFIAMSGENKNNKAIRVDKTLRDGNDLILHLTITRQNSDSEETIPVTYVADQGEFTDEVVMKGDTLKIRKVIALPKNQRKGYGHVSLLPDANTRDNVSYFVYGEKTAIQTAVVAETQEIEGKLLQASSIFEHLKSVSYTPETISQIDFDTTPLILWQAPLPVDKNAERIEDYINKGGIVLFFPPLTETANTFFDLSWGPIQYAGKSDFFLINDWNQQDGPFRDGISGHSLPMHDLDAIRRRQILGDSIALATWDDGEVFGTRKIKGEGRALFISTLPDLGWSQIEHQGVFLITVYRMIELAMERFNATGATEVGSDITELRAQETRTRIDNYESTNRETEAENTAGVWKLGQRVLATNRPVSEDFPESLELEETISPLIPDAKYTLLEDTGQDEPEAYDKKIWKYFLYAMLLFLILEAILTLPKRISNKKAQAIPSS